MRPRSALKRGSPGLDHRSSPEADVHTRPLSREMAGAWKQLPAQPTCVPPARAVSATARLHEPSCTNVSEPTAGSLVAMPPRPTRRPSTSSAGATPQMKRQSAEPADAGAAPTARHAAPAHRRVACAAGCVNRKSGNDEAMPKTSLFGTRRWPPTVSSADGSSHPRAC
jgi:hypothetical protein